MFWTFIAVIAAGFAGAGLAMALRFTFRDRMPSWLVPAAAAGAMITATISTEYTWFRNQSTNLPEGMEILTSRQSSSFYRPWTYIWPLTEGFIALDYASVRSNEALPEIELVNLYVYGRWSPIAEIPMAVDCPGSRLLTLIDIPDLTPEALGADANWTVLREDDPIWQALCAEGES